MPIAEKRLVAAQVIRYMNHTLDTAHLRLSHTQLVDCGEQEGGAQLLGWLLNREFTHPCTPPRFLSLVALKKRRAVHYDPTRHGDQRITGREAPSSV